MADTSVTGTVSDHAGVFLKIFAAVVAGLFATVKVIGSLFKKRFLAVEDGLKACREDIDKVKKIIPREAIEREVSLLTQESCAENRQACGAIACLNDVDGNMKGIRRAVLLLVLHSDKIPQEERDAIAKELIGS